MFQMPNDNNRANQKNPNHPQYGGGPGANDNKSNQLNPNNPEYRGQANPPTEPKK